MNRCLTWCNGEIYHEAFYCVDLNAEGTCIYMRLHLRDHRDTCATDGCPVVHFQRFSGVEKRRRAKERVRERTEWASFEEMTGSPPTLWAFPVAE